MWHRIFKRNILPIGVDLGSSAVKLAQLRVNGDELELIAAGSREIPDSLHNSHTERLSVIPNIVREILRSQPFKGNKSILSLPAEATFVQHLRLPRLTPEQTTQALRLELHNRIPSDAGDMVIRHIVVGDAPHAEHSQREVIAIAAARSTVDAYLSMARQARLDVCDVNIEPVAIVECFAHLLRRASDSDRTIFFLDIGETTTQVVLAHGIQIAFARNLSIGGRHFDQAIAAGMGISLEEARALRRSAPHDQGNTSAKDKLYRLLDDTLDETAAELTKCIIYYRSVFKERNIELAIFLGGQAYDRDLCQAIARRLNLPATIGNPLLGIKRAESDGLEPPLDQRQPHPDWAVAVGLSLSSIAPP